MKKKDRIVIIICAVIFCVIIFLLGIEWAEKNNESIWKFFLYGFLAILLIGGYVIKIMLEDKKEKVTYESFLLDIYKKDDLSTHIKINTNNEICKYIKSYHIISKLEEYTSSRAGYYVKYNGTNVDYNQPEYNITDKFKLTSEEVNRLLELIGKLEDDNINGDVIVVGNGFGRKCVKADSINKIISGYSRI